MKHLLINEDLNQSLEIQNSLETILISIKGSFIGNEEIELDREQLSDLIGLLLHIQSKIRKGGSHV